jgi:hypothetical protein
LREISSIGAARNRRDIASDFVGTGGGNFAELKVKKGGTVSSVIGLMHDRAPSERLLHCTFFNHCFSDSPESFRRRSVGCSSRPVIAMVGVLVSQGEIEHEE